jgi:hypothetical protein
MIFHNPSLLSKVFPFSPSLFLQRSQILDFSCMHEKVGMQSFSTTPKSSDGATRHLLDVVTVRSEQFSQIGTYFYASATRLLGQNVSSFHLFCRLETDVYQILMGFSPAAYRHIEPIGSCHDRSKVDKS